jgi:hypothetical protein
MALEEKSVVDKILKDGVEVAATYHRHVVNPGDDTANEDPRVAAIAAATWSEEVVAAYQASLPQPETTEE